MTARVRNGQWVAVYPRVYALPRSKPTPSRSIMAACLASGGVASHRAAAHLLALPGPFELDVSASRAPRRAGR